MKNILAILAVSTAFGIALPSTASADASCGRRIVSHLPCGKPVYSVYQAYGRDRCGHVLGRWVTVKPSCSCRACNPRPAVSSCDHHRHSHSNGRVGFYFSFGR